MQNETNSLFTAVYEHSRTCYNLRAFSFGGFCFQMSTLAMLLKPCNL